jgi:hypothetical protein
VPATLALQAELADSVRVLFVAPAQSLDELRTFAAARGWLESAALWTDEAPLATPHRYPAFVLLSAAGVVLLEGGAAGREAEIRACLEASR